MDAAHPPPWTHGRAAPPLAGLGDEVARLVHERRATPVTPYRPQAHAPDLLDTRMGVTGGLREHRTTPCGVPLEGTGPS